MRTVVTAGPDETAMDIARRMADLDVGDVIVVDERPGELPRPIGIVTDRDLVVRALSRSDRLSAATRVRDLMQHGLVSAREDDDVQSVLAKMRAHAIRRVPIVDDKGGLQGVISVDDILGSLRDDLTTAVDVIERRS